MTQVNPFQPSAKAVPNRTAAAAAPSPSAVPTPAPTSAPGDSIKVEGKPENWHVESTMLQLVYEKAKKAEGKVEVEQGQRIVEDIKETNLDTGEVHRLHHEQTTEGDHTTSKQSFAIFNAKGELQASESDETETLAGKVVRSSVNYYHQ